MRTVARAIGGIALGVRARWKVFAMIALGVSVLNLLLPLAVLSIARKPVEHLTVNPWLSRLPEYLASGGDSLGRKLEFLSSVALFWFTAENPMGVEWGFIVDVPSLARMVFTSLVFGAYFALWFYRRDQLRQCGPGMKAGRHGGVAGVLTSALGLSTGPCSVAGCGVPILPVLGLAFTGLPTETLKLFKEASGAVTAGVLVAMTLGVAYFGWLAGSTRIANPRS
jgi:hypothetical protein